MVDQPSIAGSGAVPTTSKLQFRTLSGTPAQSRAICHSCVALSKAPARLTSPTSAASLAVTGDTAGYVERLVEPRKAWEVVLWGMGGKQPPASTLCPFHSSALVPREASRASRCWGPEPQRRPQTSPRSPLHPAALPAQPKLPPSRKSNTTAPRSPGPSHPPSPNTAHRPLSRPPPPWRSTPSTTIRSRG